MSRNGRARALTLVAVWLVRPRRRDPRPGAGHAAGHAAPTAASGPPPMLRVFLDCDSCDEEYLRQNVQFIDYHPRSSAVADSARARRRRRGRAAAGRRGS